MTLSSQRFIRPAQVQPRCDENRSGIRCCFFWESLGLALLMAARIDCGFASVLEWA
ncbi:MAG: hypothetical protein AB8A71_06460 [Prochlorococcus sp.]